MPDSTIRTTLRRSHIRNENGESLSRDGRPSKISERDKRRILREVRHNPKHTYKEVISRLILDITPRTLSRFLDTYDIKK